MKKQRTKNEFVNLAKTVHGDKYDYSKVEYVNNHTKVCIICPEHGEFLQTPLNHLQGSGCRKCSDIETHNLQRKTKETFILDAKKIHGDKYDYSKVEYVNCDEKVCIICPKHGEFWQAPTNHLANHGCPICSESKAEKEISTILSENDISFEREKTFDWLVNKRNMFLDFYLPAHNIAIECQGAQHFFKKDNFFSETLDDIIKRDELKKKLCEEHGIKMVYYSNLKEKIPKNVVKNKDEIIKLIKYENINSS